MSEKQSTDELLESRRQTYGDRVQNMIDIAGIWSILLGVTIQPWQVPLMMDAVKQHRQFRTPDYGDTSDDREGWFKIFREVMGDDMIDARTVEEYQEKKAARHNVVFSQERGKYVEAGERLLQRSDVQLVDQPVMKYESRLVSDGDGDVRIAKVPVERHAVDGRVRGV